MPRTSRTSTTRCTRDLCAEARPAPQHQAGRQPDGRPADLPARRRQRRRHHRQGQAQQIPDGQEVLRQRRGRPRDAVEGEGRRDGARLPRGDRGAEEGARRPDAEGVGSRWGPVVPRPVAGSRATRRYARPASRPPHLHAENVPTGHRARTAPPPGPCRRTTPACRRTTRTSLSPRRTLPTSRRPTTLRPGPHAGPAPASRGTAGSTPTRVGTARATRRAAATRPAVGWPRPPAVPGRSAPSRWVERPVPVCSVASPAAYAAPAWQPAPGQQLAAVPAAPGSVGALPPDSSPPGGIEASDSTRGQRFSTGWTMISTRRLLARPSRCCCRRRGDSGRRPWRGSCRWARRARRGNRAPTARVAARAPVRTTPTPANRCAPRRPSCGRPGFSAPRRLGRASRAHPAEDPTCAVGRAPRPGA